MRSAIGETEFEMQQILGYAPIEPDGSFKLNVPADTPIGLAVVDAQGRAFQTHTNWIQVRPGERRTCDGCHSPRRGGADQLRRGRQQRRRRPSSRRWPAAHQSGETMAGTRTRLDPTALKLVTDMVSTDIWADTTKPGVTAPPLDRAQVHRQRQSGATTCHRRRRSTASSTTRTHIAPLWTRNRGAEHLHRLPQRPGQARPERAPSAAPAASCRTTS